MILFYLIFHLCTTIRSKIKVLIDFFSFVCTHPFDRNIWSSFIYFIFCARPFDQKLGSSLIYVFYLYTTIRPNLWSSFIYSLFSARPLDQKLGPTLIYFLYLYTMIRPKIKVLINLIFFFVPNHLTKNLGPH